MAKALPSDDTSLPYVGAALTRVVPHPDAVTPEIRQEFTALNEKRKNESLNAIHEGERGREES